MEPESLFRKCVTIAATGLFQKPALKQKINDYLQDEEFWSQHENLCFNQIKESAEDELDDEYDLPSSVKNEIAYLIMPLGLEIMVYAQYYKRLGCLHPEIMDDLVWNSNGSINGLESCKQIIKRDLNLKIRIRLGCIYCLEEEIKMLWSNKKKKGSFKKQLNDILFDDSLDYGKNKLIIYWLERIAQNNKNVTEIQYEISDEKAMHCAALSYNDEATKYFFEKLSPQERHNEINKCILGMSCEAFLSAHNSEFPEIQRDHILFFFIKQYEIGTLRQLCRVLDVTQLILECLMSFVYRSHFFLYHEILLPLVKNEKTFYELLIFASSKIKTDPDIYYRIYHSIWDNYCLKYEHSWPLLCFDEKKELIDNLLYSEQYDLIHLIIDKLESRQGFFDLYGRMIAEHLIPLERKDIFEDIVKKCLRTIEDVIHFRDIQNYRQELIREKYMEFHENEEVTIKPIEDIINKLLESLGCTEEDEKRIYEELKKLYDEAIKQNKKMKKKNKNKNRRKRKN